MMNRPTPTGEPQPCQVIALSAYRHASSCFASVLMMVSWVLMPVSPLLLRFLMLLGAGRLNVAPHLDRSPALIDDAAHQLVHEGELGLDQREPIVGLDHEQRRGFLFSFERPAQLLRAAPRRRVLLAHNSRARSPPPSPS